MFCTATCSMCVYRLFFSMSSQNEPKQYRIFAKITISRCNKLRLYKASLSMLGTDLHECIIVKMDILNEIFHVCMYIAHAFLFAPINLQISTLMIPTMHYNNIIIFDPFCYCLCLFTANYKCTFQTNFIAVSIEYHFICLLFYLFVYL